MATNVQNPTFSFTPQTMEKYFSDFRGAVLNFLQKYGELERNHKLTEAQKTTKMADFTSDLARSYSVSVGWATCCPRVLIIFR